MTLRFFVLSFFLFFLFVELNAQEASTIRDISNPDEVVLQEGKIKTYKGQLYRLKTAMEDNDEESISIIYEVITELMKNELEKPTAGVEKIREKQAKIYKYLSQTKIKDHKMNSEEALSYFDSFLFSMKDELELIKK